MKKRQDHNRDLFVLLAWPSSLCFLFSVNSVLIQLQTVEGYLCFPSNTTTTLTYKINTLYKLKLQRRWNHERDSINRPGVKQNFLRCDHRNLQQQHTATADNDDKVGCTKKFQQGGWLVDPTVRYSTLRSEGGGCCSR